MGEKIFKTGIKRDGELMYYIKDGDVWATPRKKPGQPKGKAQKVARAGIEMDYSRYLYYLDDDGDVARRERQVGGSNRLVRRIGGTVEDDDVEGEDDDLEGEADAKASADQRQGAVASPMGGSTATANIQGSPGAIDAKASVEPSLRPSSGTGLMIDDDGGAGRQPVISVDKPFIPPLPAQPDELPGTTDTKAPADQRQGAVASFGGGGTITATGTVQDGPTAALNQEERVAEDLSTATGVGSALNARSGVGTAAGTSTATAVGASIAVGTGTAAGTSTAQAVAESVQVPSVTVLPLATQPSAAVVEQPTLAAPSQTTGHALATNREQPGGITPYRTSPITLPHGLHPLTGEFLDEHPVVSESDIANLDKFVKVLFAAELERTLMRTLATLWLMVRTDAPFWELWQGARDLHAAWYPGCVPPEAAAEVHLLLQRVKDRLEATSLYPGIAWPLLIATVIGLAVAGVAITVIALILGLGSMSLTAGGQLLQIPQRRIKDVDDMIADVKKALGGPKAKALPQGETS